MTSLPNQEAIHRRGISRQPKDRRGAARLLKKYFSSLPDKDQAWQDLINLTQDGDPDVRMIAANTLSIAISYAPNKEQARQDLIKLAEDKDHSVRWCAVDALEIAFGQVPNKEQARQDLHRLAQDGDRDVRWCVADNLRTAFRHISNKEQAWEDLIKLAQDKDRSVRWCAADALEIAFGQVPNKEQARQDLHRLAFHRDRNVRLSVARALGAAISHIYNKDQAWEDLIRLSNDKDSLVRTCAFHSLGKASISKATETRDKATFKKELEVAIAFFERSSKESEYSPASFCYPFYRSYLAITFHEVKEDEFQRYLADAKIAVGGSESKDELLKAVENLALALQEAQRTKDMQLAGMQCDLKAYMRYCNQATEHLDRIEKDAPSATNLIRKGLPNIDQQIKEIIGSIQEKAKAICIQGKGTGTALEATGQELNRWAKGLSSEDILKSERSCSRIEHTLQKFCYGIPPVKRSQVCEVIKEICLEDKLPNKLIKIELALSYILNEWPDYDVMAKLEAIQSILLKRLDEDKQKIVEAILIAVKRDAVSQDLIVKTLSATKDFVSEIRASQLEIQYPEVSKCLDSWEEAINSPELGIENSIKVTIPIIPFLLTYEGSYKFQSGLKLDSAWTKLKSCIRP